MSTMEQNESGQNELIKLSANRPDKRILNELIHECQIYSFDINKIRGEPEGKVSMLDVL